MLDQTLAVVLAGGSGPGLQPLTRDRAKPAVPFGGKYRIIDFVLTNCLNSGLRRVLVLTQYKSHSLQKHLRDGWSIFNPELGEYITPVPPQMRAGERWYAGSADALYQNRWLIERSGAEQVLVLSGEHVYRMDYAPLLAFQRERPDAAAVAGLPAGAGEGALPGVRVDDDQRIVAMGDAEDGAAGLTPMGVYAFGRETLLRCLDEDHGRAGSTHDLALDVLPALVDRGQARAYGFGGREGRVSVDRYWRALETLDAYYEANMDLLRAKPPIDLYQDDWHIRSYSGQHPPARTVPGESGSEGICINSIVAAGAVIAGGSAQESILFSGVRLGDEALAHRAILLDGVVVGEGARVERCIVDKDVVIPPGEGVGIDLARDRERFTVTGKGVVVVPKGYRFDAVA